MSKAIALLLLCGMGQGKEKKPFPPHPEMPSVRLLAPFYWFAMGGGALGYKSGHA